MPRLVTALLHVAPSMLSLLLASGAIAREFPITDSDQATLLAVCDLAAQSPNVNRADRASIAQFCLLWQRRMEAANLAPTAPPAPAAPQGNGQ